MLIKIVYKKLINKSKIDNNNKNYLSILENILIDILKEKHKENSYKPIQDLHPKIYEVFIFSNIKVLEKIFPDLYLFLNDIRIYLITYTVITTYLFF